MDRALTNEARTLQMMGDRMHAKGDALQTEAATLTT